MLVLLFSALLYPLAARAQTNSSTPPPSAGSIEDDPQFKQLSPDQQALVRKAMQNIDKVIADERSTAVPNGVPPKATFLPAQTGCPATPVKKPRFHLPKAVQDAINKQAKQIGSKTGVDLDSKAPEQVLKDAQGKPCPSAAPAKPAAK